MGSRSGFREVRRICKLAVVATSAGAAQVSLRLQSILYGATPLLGIRQVGSLVQVEDQHMTHPGLEGMNRGSSAWC